jgi:dTDP-4-dehydrorhamnose reductase
MNILLLGNKGQLGWELQRALSRMGGEAEGPATFQVKALDYPEVDLADENALRRIVRDAPHRRLKGAHGERDSIGAGFHLVFNAAAYTDVDRAQHEPSQAMAINGRAPGILAEEARAMGACFIHFSTDYVFDGKKQNARPREFAASMGHLSDSTYVESDIPKPLNIYGKTKLAGEQAVEQIGGAYLIFRTAWLYSLRQSGSSGQRDPAAMISAGAHSAGKSTGPEASFVEKVLRWSREKETLKIIFAQVSNPTWARALAEAMARIVKMARTAGKGEERLDPAASINWLSGRAGLYHLAGDGFTTRLEWARMILELDPLRSEQKVREILPAQTTDFPSAAARPLMSALDCGKFERTFGFKLSPWRDSLRQALAEQAAAGD